MNKTVKFLKIVCYVMLALTPLWVIFYCIQSYFVLTSGNGEGVIHWDSPMIGLKLSMFIVHRIALLTLACLFAAFIINILRYLKDGTIFNRANVTLLWIMVCVLPIYSFLSDNMSIVCSTSEHGEVVLTDNVFLYPLIALIIAFLYKIAYDVAEEQKLTI